VIGPLIGNFSPDVGLNQLLVDSNIEAQWLSTDNNEPLVSITFKPIRASEPIAQSTQSTEYIEEVITIRSRVGNANKGLSPFPIDSFASDEIISQGFSDLGNILRNIVPSLALEDHPISDATALIRPANLRRLPADNILLLVNGKRRHRASVITWQGNGVSDAAQGPDLTAIPIAAIDSIELLRDGAAAQYGSDAIAGVINIRLKNTEYGGEINARHGFYQDGGEQNQLLSINKGLPIGDSGFLNLSAEYRQAEPTDRSTQRSDVTQLRADGYNQVPLDPMDFGTPELHYDGKLFANFSAPINQTTEFYGHGNYNLKKSEGSFFYRNPTERLGVYSNGEGLLIGALDGNTASCPQVALNGNIPEADAFAQVLADPNCFSFLEQLPGGFTPRFGAEINDRSLLIGARETLSTITWDISSYYGQNSADFYLLNTVNASYGPNSPRDFDPGRYQQEEINVNADFTAEISEQLALAFGIEQRQERFSISAGQLESYTDGGLGSQGFSTTANGFAGFSPDIAGRWARRNTAIYLDGEFKLADKFLLTAALRAEHYSDFGSTVNYKLGGSYQITDDLLLRATTSTGFKAPTPGQSNTTNLTTINESDGLITRATIAPTSELATQFGGRELRPDESTNYSMGLSWQKQKLALSVDIFRINVDNRLSLSQPQPLDSSQRQTLINNGFSSIADAQEFRFITNDFDSVTQGADVIVTIKDTNPLGATQFSLTYNYTNTLVRSFDSSNMTLGRQRLLENSTPETRWRVSLTHQLKPLRISLSSDYFGEFYDDNTIGFFDENYLVNMELAATLSKNIEVQVGGQNIFNEKGCTVDECSESARTELGQIYSEHSPFGFNGAFWYANFSYFF
jgi:iron complex outermembrane receptor protein